MVGCVRRWGAVLGIVGGSVTFRFLNGEAGYRRLRPPGVKFVSFVLTSQEI